MFLVISGFILSSVTIKHLLNGMSGLTLIKNFFLRRFFRIFPVAFFIFILVFCASIFFQQPKIFSTPNELLKAGGAIFSFWFNFYINAHKEQTLVIGPYWSLSLEEQFYFCFPFFLIFITSVRKRIFIYSALLLIITFYIRPFIINNFYYTPSRCDGLLYGCLLYYFMSNAEIRLFFLKLKKFYIGNFLAILLLCIISALPSLIQSLIISLPLICISAFFLVALSTLESGFISFGFFNRILDYLGARSYSLYLIHFPIFMLTQAIWLILSQHYHFQLNAQLSGAYTITGLVLIIIATELSYRCIEQPFLLYGQKLIKRMPRST